VTRVPKIPIKFKSHHLIELFHVRALRFRKAEIDRTKKH